MAASGFGLSMLVATLLARAPMVAFFGASGRQMGSLAWILYAVAFVVGVSLYQGEDTGQMASAIVLAMGGAVLGLGVVGLLEAVGNPVVPTSQAFAGRLQASLGNPAVLGAFLTLALPILVVAAVSRLHRGLALAAVPVGGWLLIASGTRGAWVGLVIGSLFGLVMAVRAGVFDLSRGRAIVTVAIVLFVASTLVTGRWATAGDAFEGRIHTWEVAGRVLGHNPWFGVGPEGFAQAFAEHVDERFVVSYTRDNVNDRAHAGIIDAALSVGLIGLTFYLAVLAWVLRTATRAARVAGSRSPIVIGIAVAIVAYLVQQQALFQLAGVDLVFWLLVGLISTAAVETRPAPRLAAGLMVATALVASIYGVLGVVADRHHRSAMAASDPRAAIEAIEAAASLRPFDGMHALMAALVTRSPVPSALFDRALTLHDDALRWAPNDGTLMLSKSGVLVAQFRESGDRELLLEARSILAPLTEVDRTNGEGLLRLGAIAFYLDDYAAAEVHWQRAADLMPHRKEPTDNLKLIDGLTD